MPRTISRDEALVEIARDAPPGCFLCALAAEPLVAAAHSALVLPRYGVRWGALLVVTRAHVTSFAELDREVWLELADLAWRSARALERVLAPLRCYVAALGSARDDLPMSSPHLHLQIIPIFDKDDKPASVLSWTHGVVVGSPDERRTLAAALTAALDPLR